MTVSEDLIYHIVNVALQVICFSAIATDWHQSQFWAYGPVVGGSSILIEGNPAISDDPSKLKDTVEFNRAVTYLAPKMLDPPWSTSLLAAIALVQVTNVVGNNTNAELVGLPRRWTVGYVVEF